MYPVAITDIGDEIVDSIAKNMSLTIGNVNDIIKGSGEVYIKPNGIDFKPYSYSSPEVLKALIELLFEKGADKVFIMENSTQGNMTRLVFKFTGYDKICKETGAKPLYLDESKVVKVKFPHFQNPVRIAKILVDKFIDHKDKHTYIDLPKLKTHSMTTVTLGIKNQMAFIDHSDRMKYHDWQTLHQLLADAYSIIKPDYTLVDGQYAIYNGHYPIDSFVEESIDPLNILIGGPNALAVDIVASKILGYQLSEIKHLSLAAKANDLNITINDLKIYGDITKYKKKYPCDILPNLPKDVRIIKGNQLLCKEGCELNTLMVLQMLAFDFNGKGGFTILMGKGFDKEALESINEPVLLAGKCAIEETYEFLKKRIGKKKIYQSPYCNNLAMTLYSLCKLMKVHPLKIVPSKRKALTAMFVGKLRHSRANMPPLI